jgi:hypothetical protein
MLIIDAGSLADLTPEQAVERAETISQRVTAMVAELLAHLPEADRMAVQAKLTADSANGLPSFDMRLSMTTGAMFMYRAAFETLVGPERVKAVTDAVEAVQAGGRALQAELAKKFSGSTTH